MVMVIVISRAESSTVDEQWAVRRLATALLAARANSGRRRPAEGRQGARNLRVR
jgi:hypothetical protein